MPGSSAMTLTWNARTASTPSGLLPRQIPDVPGLELAYRYVPAETAAEVGGDWFDVITLRPGWRRDAVAAESCTWRLLRLERAVRR